MHSREKDLGELVMTVARSMRRHHIATLEPFELSPSHGRALRVLANADSALRPGDLAERLRIAPRSATEVVDGLESGGYLARRADSRDRRAVLLELTDTGRTLAAAVADAQKAASDRLFSVLSEQERATLVELLGRVGEPPSAEPGDEHGHVHGPGRKPEQE